MIVVIRNNQIEKIMLDDGRGYMTHGGINFRVRKWADIANFDDEYNNEDKCWECNEFIMGFNSYLVFIVPITEVECGKRVPICKYSGLLGEHRWRRMNSITL